MDWDEFEAWGAHVSRWAADYHKTLRDLPVRAQTKPGDTARALASAPPSKGEPMDAIMADFELVVLPAMTHWQPPPFLCLLPSECGAAVYDRRDAGHRDRRAVHALADFPRRHGDGRRHGRLAEAGLGASGRLHRCYPGQCLLRRAFGSFDHAGARDRFFPGTGKACTAKEGSGSTARTTSTARSIARPGLPVSDGRICGQAADPSRALRARRGSAPNYRRRKPSGGVREDRAAGHVPAGIIAITGGTGVGASDDLAAVLDVARKADLYTHLDAAWAGAAMICEEFREDFWAGVEGCDSVVINPHKWLGAQFDCSVQFPRDYTPQLNTLKIEPENLKTTGAAVTSYSEWTIPPGRRFRALKIWFLIRSYGLDGLKERLRDHVLWASEICELVREMDGFEIVTEPILSLFTKRHVMMSCLPPTSYEAYGERRLDVCR